eukprot:5674606-Prymnesium_polylepis.1
MLRVAALGAVLAVLGAVAAESGTIECDECDAGQACGMCLMLVPESECPSGSDWRADPNLKDGCTSEMVIGNLCEADGHCGTSDDANNCPGGRGGSSRRYDVYKRVTCRVTRPRPLPPPPLPSCESLQCDAGLECGICLQRVASDECPHGW